VAGRTLVPELTALADAIDAEFVDHLEPDDSRRCSAL